MSHYRRSFHAQLNPFCRPASRFSCCLCPAIINCNNKPHILFMISLMMKDYQQAERAIIKITIETFQDSLISQSVSALYICTINSALNTDTKMKWVNWWISWCSSLSSVHSVHCYVSLWPEKRPTSFLRASEQLMKYFKGVNYECALRRINVNFVILLKVTNNMISNIVCSWGVQCNWEVSDVAVRNKFNVTYATCKLSGT